MTRKDMSFWIGMATLYVLSDNYGGWTRLTLQCAGLGLVLYAYFTTDKEA